VLEKHLSKNNEGEFLPLTLITHDYIAKDIALKFAEKKVTILPNSANLSLDNQSTLELTEIKMNDKKSILAFKYAHKTIKIKLKKEGKEWIAKTISVKWKNRIETQFI